MRTKQMKFLLTTPIIGGAKTLDFYFVDFSSEAGDFGHFVLIQGNFSETKIYANFFDKFQKRLTNEKMSYKRLFVLQNFSFEQLDCRQ